MLNLTQGEFAVCQLLWIQGDATHSGHQLLWDLERAAIVGLDVDPL